MFYGVFDGICLGEEGAGLILVGGGGPFGLLTTAFGGTGGGGLIGT